MTRNLKMLVWCLCGGAAAAVVHRGQRRPLAFAVGAYAGYVLFQCAEWLHRLQPEPIIIVERGFVGPSRPPEETVRRAAAGIEQRGEREPSAGDGSQSAAAPRDRFELVELE